MSFRISEKVFLFVLIFMKGTRKKLKKMKTNLNEKFYLVTVIEYTKENGEIFTNNGYFKHSEKRQKFKTKKVIRSKYFTKEHGEPEKHELKSLKDRKRDYIVYFKNERRKIMSKFDYMFIGIIVFLLFKLFFLDTISYLENISERYLAWIYYVAVVGGYLMISNMKRKVMSMRLKAYRNHLILIYIESVYSHLTDQSTTTSKLITYDKDGFPKNLYSSSLIDVVTITLGQFVFILLMILGYYIFK